MSAYKIINLPGNGEWKMLFDQAEQRGIKIIGTDYEPDTVTFVGLFVMLAEMKEEIAALKKDSHPPAVLPIEQMQCDIRRIKEHLGL